ncbi:hypothetical protein [Vampirovibrio chlorellavorus]|uniref:hypothetical protein n=1 Tax=Vampirovibrio chlorellavorus TaxID=758823 RepID=UPI0026F06B99|nr:hypothetical protein [Vampirovibrio chlorellavorus]
MKKYVEKFEALDLTAGLYQTRSLKRQRYKQKDFIEYLDAYDTLNFESELGWPEAGQAEWENRA